MKKFAVVFLLSLSITGLCACGKSSANELKEYYTSMSSFYSSVNELKADIEMIDMDEPDANLQLLKLLDSMQVQFDNCANTPVPIQFGVNETLSYEASAYMTEAVSLFHEYMDDPEATEEVYKAAMANYDRAMTRLSYIAVILKGEIPQGEGVQYIEEDGTDFEPVMENEGQGE